MKIASIAIILLIIALTGVYAGNMQLQFGSYVARAIGTSGRVQIAATGGSGSYAYQFSNLPAGWTFSNNILTIPNINSIQGQSFNVAATVRDGSSGQLITVNVVLTVSGVRINVANGGAVDGTFGVSGSGTSSSGSSSSSGSPSTSSGTFTPSSSVSPLYSSYQGLPGGSSTPSGPERTPSPAGAPSIPNSAPQIIANAQASFNANRDTNKITIDDVKRTAIFNRQINANKAVANLVSIVQKLTANVNAATNDITVLTKFLSDAEAVYNTCQAEVFNLANTRAQVQNAIADRQTQIADTNAQIEGALIILKGLQKELDNLIAQRNAIEAARSPNADKLTDLESQLKTCLARAADLEKQLNGLNQQITGINSDIQNTQDGASAAPGQIAQIDRQIPIVDNKIADLEKQLADAKAEKEQLLTDKDAAQAIIDAANSEVNRLKAILTGLESRVPGLQTQIDSTNARCNQIQASLATFRDQLAAIQDSYNTLLNEIAAQQGLVDSKNSDIDGLRNAIKDFPNDLKLLRAEWARIDNSLRRQYYICDAAADDVRRAKENLEAMRVRLDADTASLRNSNRNLEAARAQKQLADIAVEQIISVYTSALPFSIVPNGNGVTDAGIPIGNNPSGSPLGPVQVTGQIVSQEQVTVGDLNTYLSTAYRAGVDPARPSTVTTLYPLSVATIRVLSSNLNSFTCGGSNAAYGSGTITSVQPGSINVASTNGESLNLQVAGCTNLESVNQGQVLGAGDKIYYRGSKTSGNKVQLTSLTCM